MPHCSCARSRESFVCARARVQTECIYVLRARAFANILRALHLYNALKQRKKDEFVIPFLETLDKAFSSTKAIWVGGRPERGSYCKSFWIAWGLSFEEASKLGSRPVGRDKVVASITKNSRKPMTR